MSDKVPHQTGFHKQGYKTTLKEANPEKKSKDDWWDELCKKHGAKNHFPKKGK